MAQAAPALREALDVRDPTAEAMEVCSAALSGPRADPWDVAEIFEKLREWLRRDVGVAQKLLRGAGLQARIVEALRRHGANLEVARHGAAVVAGVCQRSTLSADFMVSEGIVPELLLLMDRHRTDTVAQDHSCVALWRLAQCNGMGAEHIVRAGGLARIFRAQEEHAHNPFVQVNACMAMERLYIKGVAPADGMREAAENAMQRHPSNTQIKRGARRLLEVLQGPCTGPAAPATYEAPGRPAAPPQRRPPSPPTAVPVREEHAPQRAAPEPSSGGAAGAPRRAEATVALSNGLSAPLREWLLELDSVGFLLEYQRILQKHFSSVAQVVDYYAPSGILEQRFFDDLGVWKLGHRRLFEKWCRDELPDRRPELARRVT